MNHRNRFVLCAACAVLFAGCSVMPTEKRHSPAEIAAYRETDFVAPIASEAGEQVEVAAALESIRQATELQKASTDSSAVLPDALGALGHFNVEAEKGRALVLNALTELARDPATKSNDYQRAVLSAAHALYPVETAPQTMSLLDQISTPRQFAIAAYAVLKASSTPAVREAVREKMRARFPLWDQKTPIEPRLRALDHVLTTDTRAELATRPPLIDLLTAPYRAGMPVIFSFQRADRQRFGLALVRAADGRFVRNADGSLFAIAHLANALSNLPGTITNGNTPQGLFTIVGSGSATNKWIGPTPYLESKVPIEAKVAEFEHTPIGGEWTEARYESYLPASWRSYFPFKEAWLAGQAGRDEMLLHGTTINAAYYTGKPFYPGTPSAGCLVALESWSKADGKMQRSDQLSLAKAFTKDGLDRGYLVVVELDDRAEPVVLAELVADVLMAERR